MKNTYDFAIVGGGLVGMAIAYGLAKRGQTVVVLDGEDASFRARAESSRITGAGRSSRRGFGPRLRRNWKKRRA